MGGPFMRKKWDRLCVKRGTVYAWITLSIHQFFTETFFSSPFYETLSLWPVCQWDAKLIPH